MFYGYHAHLWLGREPTVTGIKDGWHEWLVKADSAALAGMGGIGAVITVTAFVESYGNLYDYALLVGMTGWRARIAPLGVDLLILTGELLLFVAIARGWERRTKIYGWALVITGLALSVAGNVGHLHQAGWQTRVTSALWPAVLTGGLAAWLMALKRVSESYRLPVRATSPQPQKTARPPASRTAKPASQPAGKPAAGKSASRRGRPLIEVPVPAGALAAAAAQKVSPRKLQPWLVGNYDYEGPEIGRIVARRLLAAAGPVNGHDLSEAS
jgi:Protein of unknown function (DUF2637)